MQPRVEALVGLGVLAVLVLMAGALGQRENRAPSADPRASSLLTGPLGARALADGLTRLGVEVRRQRRPLRRLAGEQGGDSATALLLLDPLHQVRGTAALAVLDWSRGPGRRDLLLAGPGAAWLMRCFGYAIDWRDRDSVAIRGGHWPLVAGVLAASSEPVVTDSSRGADAAPVECTVPTIGRVDTLLLARTGRVVALRLHRLATGGAVLLLADAGLLRNRALRDTDAGPFALGLLAGPYRRVIFEESQQGFGEGGSLGRALAAWSGHSPLGWALWQAMAVGLLALGGSAVRFGPVRPPARARRRSPLEHVRALATALAAARGHDVAIGLLIEGLRRRLRPAGQRPRGDRAAWLAQLAGTLRSPRARDAVRTLETLNRPGQSADQVRRAANAVEDVWQELRP
jgi:hypothetical protein